MTRILGAVLLASSFVLFAAGGASADVSCNTDFNADGATNDTDLEILQQYMGASEDQDGYTSAVDLNADGVIDIADLNAFLNCN